MVHGESCFGAVTHVIAPEYREVVSHLDAGPQWRQGRDSGRGILTPLPEMSARPLWHTCAAAPDTQEHNDGTPSTLPSQQNQSQRTTI